MMRHTKAPLRTMQIRLAERHLNLVDRLVRQGVYENRSAAIRDAVRRQFEPLFRKTVRKR